MNTKIMFLLFFFIPFFFKINLCAQSTESPLIVNEIGVFSQSKDRYIELLVLGENGQAANHAIDISAWSIDNFSSADPTDMGFISLGSAFANMYPGTLILIYDGDYPNVKIDPAEDGLPNS